MAVAFRASNVANSSTSTTSLAITKPSGTASGDILVAGLVVGRNVPSWSPPSGFTQLGSDMFGAGNFAGAVWLKVAGGSEPASYSFGFSSAGAAGFVAAYSGGDSTIISDALDQSGATNGPFGVHYDDAMHVVVWASDGVTPAFDPPSGMTERAETQIGGSGNNTGRIAVDDVVLGTSGLVEPVTPTSRPSGFSTQSVGFTLPPSGGTYKSLFKRVGMVAINPRVKY